MPGKAKIKCSANLHHNLKTESGIRYRYCPFCGDLLDANNSGVPRCKEYHHRYNKENIYCPHCGEKIRPPPENSS